MDGITMAQMLDMLCRYLSHDSETPEPVFFPADFEVDNLAAAIKRAAAGKGD